MRYPQRYMLTGILLVGLVVAGSFVLANRQSGDANSPNCAHTGQRYQVVIENDHASPENTDARLCDKLEFINKDNVTREIAFGPHEHHVPYDGVDARLLRHNQSFTITLNTVGLIHFHDHFHDEVSGFFSVSK